MFDEQTLIQAKELREKTLKPAVLRKVCKLLKHDVSRWNEFFYSSERSQKIKDLLEDKDKVVIVGSSGLGKTRIVIEVLRQLSFEKKFNDMIVVAVDPSLETGKRPIIEKRFWRKWSVVVLFFDDLERYLGAFDLADFVANFYKVAERVIVVATCHKEVFNAICEKPEFTRFFSKENTLELCEYSNDEGKRIAAGLNKPFPEDFTGTVDQLVLDTLRKRQNYEENLDDNEKAILKSAKLLRTCYISAYSAQLLKAVWKQIFDGKGDWDGYFSKIVESYSMLRILPSSGVEKYSIADAYLDDKKGVICEYPSCKTEIVDDARLLKEILFEMKAIDELFAVGYFLANQGLYEDALAYFECVLKLKNDNYASWFNKGVALGKLGRYEEALAAFSKAIELKPDDYDAWFNKGVVFLRLGRYEEALTDFNKVIELDPNSHKAWFNKGVALEKLGRHEEALRAFEKAMELDSNIISLAKVAQLLLILGDYTKGLNMAEKAFAISKTTEEKALSCLIKVSAYYLLNKIKEAEEEKSIMINLSTQGEKIKTPWDFSELLLAIEKLDNEKKKAILDLISYFTQK